MCDVFCVTEIDRLCDPLQCDDQCEVAAVSDVAEPDSIVEAYCTCSVGFMRVRVQANLKCNSKYLVTYSQCNHYIRQVNAVNGGDIVMLDSVRL